MLTKTYRFHSRGGVKHAYRAGKTIRHPDLSLVFCDNPKGFTRFAVVVSKKVLRSAVGRNRIRRRVYEAIRLNLSEFKQPRDYVFVIYSQRIKSLPFSELEKEIRELSKESMLQ